MNFGGRSDGNGTMVSPTIRSNRVLRNPPMVKVGLEPTNEDRHPHSLPYKSLLTVVEDLRLLYTVELPYYI